MSTDASSPRLQLALPALLGLSLACAAHAQSAPTPAAAATTAPEPKVERFVHQDGYSRIEELRIGGRTRSIEVQTRSGLAGYEVRPLDPSQDDQRSGAGQRRWRVLAF